MFSEWLTSMKRLQWIEVVVVLQEDGNLLVYRLGQYD